MDITIDRRRLFVPAVAPLYAALAPLSLPLIRIALGIILMTHGFGKVFGDDAVRTSQNFVRFGWSYPVAWAYFIGVLEFLGGALFAAGLFTRFLAAAFTTEMAVISFAILWPNWGWTQRGMEYALFMGIVSLAIFFRGGERYSLDRFLGREF